MPQSLGQMYVHAVLPTWRRHPFFADRGIRRELHAYITGICANWTTVSIRTGGVADHVHLLARLSRENVFSEIVQEVKRGTSRWLQRRHRMLDFDWSNDDVAFSVSPAHVDAVTDYIQRDESRHCQKTLDDEVADMLQRTPKPELPEQIYVHVIFSTKNRIPYLTDRKVREELHQQIAALGPRWGSTVLNVGGIEDHVHLLCTLSQEYSVARVLQELKKSSTNWIKRSYVEDFDWQDGYGALTVSPSEVETITHYIDNQEEHHHAEAFEDEMTRIWQHIPRDEP